MSTIHEPPVVALDLSSQAFKQNPYPALAQLRGLGPLIRVRLPLLGKVWLATTYESANEVLRDHHRFVQNPASAGNGTVGSILRWLPRSLKPLTTHMLLRDPPDHRRLRSLVDQAFRKQSVEALRPRLEALADEALDRFEVEAARSPHGVDLIAHFARPFPLAVICEILGLPPEDRPQFSRWASRMITANGTLGLIWALATGVRKLMTYVREEIRRQTREPRGGLIASLIEAEEAGDRLSEDELVAMVFLLLAAGHETTLHQIALNVLILLDHPEALSELKADWSLSDSAAQELLRYALFALVSKPRFAIAETEFYDQPIRRGQTLVACLGSANTDPSVFDDPDRLDIHRHPNRHLTFGAGIHVCLGAQLARVETAIANERIFTRFPNLHLAIPRSKVRHSTRMGTRALMALPVAL